MGTGYFFYSAFACANLLSCCAQIFNKSDFTVTGLSWQRNQAFPERSPLPSCWVLSWPPRPGVRVERRARHPWMPCHARPPISTLGPALPISLYTPGTVTPASVPFHMVVSLRETHPGIWTRTRGHPRESDTAWPLSPGHTAYRGTSSSVQLGSPPSAHSSTSHRGVSMTLNKATPASTSRLTSMGLGDSSRRLRSDGRGLKF